MTANPIVKTCPRHGALRAGDLYTWTWRTKTYKRCHQCIIDKSRRYEAAKAADPEHRAHRKARRAAEWQANKQTIMAQRQTPEALAKRREWYQAHAERIRPELAEKQRKYREELADPYIKKLIQNGNKAIKISQIPDSLVKFKRTLIQLKKAVDTKQRTKLLTTLEEKLQDVNNEYRTTQKRPTGNN